MLFIAEVTPKVIHKKCVYLEPMAGGYLQVSANKVTFGVQLTPRV
jgi:hypothetical protein